MQRLKAFLPLALLIVVGAVLLATGVLKDLRPEHLLAEQEHLHALIATSPILSRVVFIAAVMSGVATGMPGTIVLVLAGGMLFGIVEGTLLSAAGLMLGSLILFFASRAAFRAGQREPPPLVTRVRSGFLSHPASYTLFLRLIPIFPYGAVTVALAWLRCPLWIFLIASAVGGTVMLAFETTIGAGLAQQVASGAAIGPHLLLEPRIALPLLALAIFALIPVALHRRGATPPVNRA